MVLIENSFKEENIMKNKLLLGFILIASGLNSFTNSPIFMKSDDCKNMHNLSMMYARMNGDFSDRDKPFLKDSKNFDNDKVINNNMKNIKSNNLGAYSATPAADFTKPIEVKNTPMVMKVVFPLVGLGGLKLAYDFLKKQEASALDVQQAAEINGNNFKSALDVQQIVKISGNNFKKISAIGVTFCALAYGGYKLYNSDFFTKSKQVSEEKE
jgi:hypothetical protein